MPDGSVSRIGHEDRRMAIKHIKDMEEKGYLPADEATKRIEHVANADSQTVLRAVTADLPGPIDRRGYWGHWDWDSPKYYVPVLLGTMFVSLCSGLVPGIVLAMLHEFNTPMGVGLFIPLVVLGVIGFFATLVTLVIKSS